MRRRPLDANRLAGAGALALAVALSACGSRSMLDGAIGYYGPGGPGEPDASAGADASLDAPEEPGEPPVDAPLPPIESGPLPDVMLSNCSGPSILYVYVVTTANNLWSFDPRSGAFRSIGPLQCSAAAGTSPFSMAVDRRGVAYVEYDDLTLFRVSVRDGTCAETPFVAPQSIASTGSGFGMGFVANPDGVTDTLYIAPRGQLDTLDLTTFQTTFVGPFLPDAVELTGTGDGRLFTYFATGAASGPPTAIDQVDPATGARTASTPLSNVTIGNDFAFGYWGGDFYVFNGNIANAGPGSTVTRFRPSDGSQVVVATLPEAIVGAGVSTCAPQL